jgi:hypothetical protein
LSEIASKIRRRAAGLCEYCHFPEAAFRRPFHIEHVIARQHGGASDLDNLALACRVCNQKKGPNLTGIDPQSGELTRLFNPRKDRWGEHFCFEGSTSISFGIKIRGLTAVGRTTVSVLGMNIELRQVLRHQLWREGISFDLPHGIT